MIKAISDGLVARWDSPARLKYTGELNTRSNSKLNILLFLVDAAPSVVACLV